MLPTPHAWSLGEHTDDAEQREQAVGEYTHGVPATALVIATSVRCHRCRLQLHGRIKPLMCGVAAAASASNFARGRTRSVGGHMWLCETSASSTRTQGNTPVKMLPTKATIVNPCARTLTRAIVISKMLPLAAQHTHTPGYERMKM